MGKMYDYSKKLEKLNDTELYRKAREHITFLLMRTAKDEQLYERVCKLERVVNECFRRLGLTWEEM